jgi:4-amino-4-deoxy-L-arabinose transferase-like glycosyltransferase
MKVGFLKRRYPFIILFLLIFFYGINNYIWLRMHQFPAYGDEAYHLLKALEYLDILSHPTKDMFSALLRVDNLRPPFFHLCLAVSNIICGKSKIVSIMANIFFAGVLFFSVYYMGKKLENKNAGLLAAFTVALYPFVFGLSRVSLSYFASMSLVSLSLLILIYTDKFKRTFPSILLGLFLALGALTRSTFVFFVIGPLITIVIIALNDKNSVRIRKRIILNLCLAVIIAALLAGIWYFPRLFLLLRTFRGYIFYEEFLPQGIFPDIFSFSNFIYYFRALVNGQLSPLFVLLFFGGLIGILKGKRGKLNAVLFSWIIVPYIIFMLFPVKFIRFTSEYLPVFALITGIGIMRLPIQWVRRPLILIIIFGGLFEFFIISFTIPSSTGLRLSFSNFEREDFKRLLTLSDAYSNSDSLYLYPVNEVSFHYPRKGDWRIDDIFSTIQREEPVSKEKITIGFTNVMMRKKLYWWDVEKKFLSKSGFYGENTVVTDPCTIEYFLEMNGLFNYYHTITLANWDRDWRQRALLDFIVSIIPIENLAPLVSKQYKLILQTEVPDGSLVYVYKRLFESG